MEIAGLNVYRYTCSGVERGAGGGGGYCPGARASCGGPGQAGFFFCVDRKSVGDPGGGSRDDPPPLELVPILKTYAKCFSEGGWRHADNVQGGGGVVLVNVFTPPPPLQEILYPCLGGGGGGGSMSCAAPGPALALDATAGIIYIVATGTLARASAAYYYREPGPIGLL